MPPFVLSALLFAVALTTPTVSGLRSKRQDVSIATTFNFDGSCSSEQQATINQAQKDALTLANAALDQGRELFTIPEAGGKTVNFRTKPAIDFWGPPQKNAAYQDYIVNTLYRATQTYRGRGWSDWWNNRYVTVGCHPKHEGCRNDTIIAFTDTRGTLLYPFINYCSLYFTNQTSHGDAVKRVQDDTTGEMRLNTLNLDSQAVTTLHEWLHIGGYSSEICHGGCDDVVQKIGGIPFVSYETGPSKLLAQRDVQSAARNNENYVYFAVARFMQKTFGTYPPYPRAWLASKTPGENLDRQSTEPGYPMDRITSTNTDFPDQNLTVTTDPAPASDYPDWYQPVIQQTGGDTEPAVNEPTEDQLPVAEPDANIVSCDTSKGRADFDDCVHAFGALNNFGDQAAHHGKNGEVWWAGYVQSCAIAVVYGQDWNDTCKATLNDIKGHAEAIFKGCQDKSSVAGLVPFETPNCPGSIAIVNTGG